MTFLSRRTNKWRLQLNASKVSIQRLFFSFSLLIIIDRMKYLSQRLIPFQFMLFLAIHGIMNCRRELSLFRFFGQLNIKNFIIAMWEVYLLTAQFFSDFMGNIMDLMNGGRTDAELEAVSMKGPTAADYHQSALKNQPNHLEKTTISSNVGSLAHQPPQSHSQGKVEREWLAINSNNNNG